MKDKIISNARALFMITWIAVAMMALSAGYVILVVSLVKMFGHA
jgi:hypothetical protein